MVLSGHLGHVNEGVLLMAYTPRNPVSNGNFQKAAAAPVSAVSGGDKVEALLTTGLFAPDKDSKSKAIGSVKVKEAITIPAGSYINLYENDRRKSDTDPLFRLQIREATKK
jgi:hypothetical protein